MPDRRPSLEPGDHASRAHAIRPHNRLVIRRPLRSRLNRPRCHASQRSHIGQRLSGQTGPNPVSSLRHLAASGHRLALTPGLPGKPPRQTSPRHSHIRAKGVLSGRDHRQMIIPSHIKPLPCQPDNPWRQAVKTSPCPDAASAGISRTSSRPRPTPPRRDTKVTPPPPSPKSRPKPSPHLPGLELLSVESLTPTTPLPAKTTPSGQAAAH